MRTSAIKLRRNVREPLRELISDNCVWAHCTTWRTGRIAFIWPVAVYVLSHIGYSGLVFFPRGSHSGWGRRNLWYLGPPQAMGGLRRDWAQVWWFPCHRADSSVWSLLPAVCPLHCLSPAVALHTHRRAERLHSQLLTETYTLLTSHKCTVTKTIRLPMWIT